MNALLRKVKVRDSQMKLGKKHFKIFTSEVDIIKAMPAYSNVIAEHRSVHML